MTDSENPTIPERFERVRAAIAEACGAAGRSPDSVALVAVSKTQPASAIREALLAGQRLFGENRVQEASEKWPALRDEFPDIRLHLIGHLQTNKAEDAVALFDLIETVDRPKLARALARAMAKLERVLPCYVQVNVGREPQKGGVDPDDAARFVAECREQHGLDIRGLMCIPPVDEDPAPYFRWLAETARSLGLPDVSMGMSADFPEAVAAGATLVRVGTALFGPRQAA